MKKKTVKPAHANAKPQYLGPQPSEILECITDAFYAVDVDWRLTYINHRAEEWWQRRREELLGTVLWDMFPEPEKTVGWHMHHQAARERVPVHWETFSPYLKVWVDANAYPTSDGGIAVYIRDITERKQVEEALRQAQEDLERKVKERTLELQGSNDQLAFQGRLLASVHDAITATDENYTITYWNNIAEKLFGWTAEEVLGQSSKGIFGTVVPNSTREVAIGQMLKDDCYTGEVIYHHKDGREIYTSVHSRVLRGRNREFKGTVTSFRDITERKRAEEALRESEDRLRFVLESCNIGAWDMDLENHTTIRNPEHDKIYGYDAMLPEWTYEKFLEHVIPEDRARVDTIFQQAVKAKTGWTFEFRIRRPDGQLRWIWATGNHKQDPDGVSRRVAGTVIDVTEKKLAEEALRKSKEWQSYLLKLSDAIRPLSDAQSIQDAAVRLLTGHLGVSQASYTDCYEDYSVIRSENLTDSMPSMAGTYKTKDYSAGIAILDSGRDMVIPDMEAFPEFSDVERSHWIALNIHAVISIPLIKKGKLAATLTVRQSSPREWTKDQVELVRETAERTWAAVERARAEEALRESRTQLEAELANTKLLQSLSAELLHEDKIQVLYDKIIDVAMQIMHSEYGSLQMLYPERAKNGELKLLAFRGFNPQATKFWEWVGVDSNSACGEALRTGQRVIVPDVEQCHFIQGTNDLAMFRQTGIRAILTMPLYSRNGRLVGMISTQWSNPHQPSERDLLQWDILTRQAADLIDRKQAEESLKEATRQAEEHSGELDAMIAAFPDGLTIYDKDGQPTYINEAAQKIFDQYETHREEELSSRGEKSRAYTLDGRPLTLETTPLYRVLKYGEIIKEFVTMLPGDTEPPIYTAVSCAPIKNSNGEIIGAVASHKDITERKRMEEEALASERELLKVTLNSLGEGVVAIDRAERIIFINEAAAKLTGFSQDEAIGELVSKILYILVDKTSEPIDIIHTQAGFQPLILATRDLGEVAISFNSAPIKATDGQITGTVIVFTDITERQKTEQEMLKTAKLNSLGILAGGVAHDFNNILAGILANLQLAMVKIKKHQDISHYMETTIDITRKASDLTKQLLTFAKGGDPIKKSASIASLIKDTVQFALSGSKVKAEFSLPEDLWIVDIDAGQISQVINNLTINAKQAMPTGGILEISGENVFFETASRYNTGQYVKLTVADHGAGIPPEIIDKIYDPFFTTKKSGNGLGLSTSYSIIKKHDGYLEVKSAPGIGTAFYILLPVSISGQIWSETKKEIAVTGGAKILLMDDEDTIRNAGGEMLACFGYQVTLARDGQEAIELYREAKEVGEPFGVVIMDLTIPGGLGGIETMAILRRIDPEVKAIISSGYASDPVMSDYESYGFKGVVTKPYKFDELLEVLNKVIDRKQLPLDFNL